MIHKTLRHLLYPLQRFLIKLTMLQLLRVLWAAVVDDNIYRIVTQLNNMFATGEGRTVKLKVNNMIYCFTRLSETYCIHCVKPI
jgi:hypothetical protein